MTIPTFTPRRRPTETGTSTRKEEAVEREWNFLAGLAAKALRLYSSAASGSVLTSDSQGNASWGTVLPSTNVQRTGGTITENATVVAAASGEYLVAVYAQCTTAGSGGTLDITFDYTDDIGATTTASVGGTLDLTGTNRINGIAMLRCAGGGIDYNFTVAGAAGGPVYAVHLVITQVR